MSGAAYRNVTLAVPLLLSVAFLWMSRPLGWRELALAVPYFLTFNMIEYLAHRWLMHRPGTILFDHVRIHHRAFPEAHLYVTEDFDKFSAVSPLYVCVSLLMVLAPAAFFLDGRLWFFLSGFGMAYYFAEELLHYAAHAGFPSPFARHHLVHHRAAGCNFNINFPVFDWVFGTMSR